jgi:hypothetical protein
MISLKKITIENAKLRADRNPKLIEALASSTRKSRKIVENVCYAVILLAIFSSSAFAANVCVGSSATGDGSGNDWNNQAAWNNVTLSRGNTYYLADGTYGSKTLSTAESGSSYIYVKKATTSSHGSSTGWQDSLGDGVALFDTASLTVSTGYWDIDGVRGGGQGSWTSGHGIAFSSNAGTAIEYLNISSGVGYLFFRHLVFFQIGDTTTGTARANAFYNSGDLNNTTIEYCYIYNIGGLPWLFRGGAGNIIQYNYTGDICGMSVADPNQHCEALVMHSMSDLHFRYNYIGECPSSGGFVKNNTNTSSDVRIYGNVFTNGFPINCNSGPCDNWRIFNNTFQAFGGGPWGGDGTKTGWLTYNNIMYNSSSFSAVGPYSWLSKVSGGQCSSGADSTSNATVRYPNNCDLFPETSDPFVNSSLSTPEAFKLAAPISGWSGYNVCLLDACTGEKKYNIDLFGNTRGAGGVWQRGAFEFVGGGISAPKTLRVITN